MEQLDPKALQLEILRLPPHLALKLHCLRVILLTRMLGLHERAQTIDELDTKLREHESRMVQMNESYQLLCDRTKELVEARHVLRETAVFFDRVRFVLCGAEGDVGC